MPRMRAIFGAMLLLAAWAAGCGVQEEQTFPLNNPATATTPAPTPVSATQPTDEAPAMTAAIANRTIRVRTIWSKTHDAAAGTTITIQLGGGEAVRRVKVADEAGEAAVDVPVLWRDAYVAAQHPRSLPASRTVDLATTDSLVLTLREGGVVFGTVRMAETGEPVEGAIVGNPQTSTDAISGADGAYELAGVPLGLRNIAAYKGKLISTDTQDGVDQAAITEGERTGPLDLFLREGHAIYGTVADESGEPVEGITIRLTGQPFNTRTARSDAQGGYRIEALPLGTFYLYAYQDDERLASAPSHTITATSDNEVNFVLQEQQASIIFGTVTEAATGAPLPYAAVASNRGNQAWAGEQGNYELSFNPGTDLEIMGRYAELATLAPVKIAAEELRPGERNGPLDLALKPGMTLAGTVRDKATKEPIAGASIQITNSNLPSHDTSAADGSFVLKGLIPDRSTLNVSADGYASFHEQIAIKDSLEDQTRDIELNAEALVFGQVLRESDGQPAPGARVEIIGQRWINTGKDGEFELDNLRPGELEIEASQGSLTSHIDPSDVLKVTLEAGQRSGPHTLYLKEGLKVRGQVTDRETGQPVASARVRAYTRQNKETETDARGQFVIEGIPLRDLSISVEHDSYFPEHKQVPQTALDEFVEIELNAGARLTGQVWVEEKGKPATSGSVRVRYGNGSSSSSIRSDGSFSLMARGEGKMRLAASMPPYISALSEEQELEIDAKFGQENGPYELILHRGLAITGLITDKDTNLPVPMAAVEANGGAMSSIKASTDLHGRYSLEGIQTGTLQMSAYSDNYIMERRQVHVALEGTPECNFALERGGDLEVHAIDEEGEAVPSAYVHISYDRANIYYRMEQTPQTDLEGKVVLPGVSRSHTIRVSASASGMGGNETTEFPPEAMRHSVTITLKKQENSSQPQTEGVVEGTVRNEDGRPLPRITMYLGSIEHYQDKTATDAAGRYRLSYRNQGHWSIYAVGDGYANAQQSIQMGTADKPAQLNFVLEAGHWLDVSVADARGNPVKTGTLNFNASNYHFNTPWKPDAKGIMRIEGLPDENISVSFSSNDGRYASGRSYPEETLEMVLPDMGVVRGRVVDAATQEPLASFRVGQSPNDLVQYTHPRGEFTLERLQINNQATIYVGADGYGTQQLNLAVQPEDSAEFVTIKMTPARIVTGYLFDAATSARVAGAKVALMKVNLPLGNANFNGDFIDSSRSIYLRWGQFEENWGQTDFTKTTTGADGTFLFEDAPETAALLLLAPGYERVIRLPHELPPPGSFDPVAVALKKGGAIAGTVTGAESLRSLSASLSEKHEGNRQGPNQHFENATINAQKTQFRWDSLAPGTYNISVSCSFENNQHTSYQKEVTIESGKTTSVEIAAGEGNAALFGIVTVGGEPRKDLSISLISPGEQPGRSYNARTDDEGIYRFDSLTAGEYRLNVGGLDYGMTIQRDITVQGIAREDIAIGAPHKVTGKVIISADPAPGKWRVTQMYLQKENMTPNDQIEGLTRGHQVPLRNGQFTFEGRFKGTYQLRMEVSSDSANTHGIQLQNLELDNLQGDQDVGGIAAPPLSMVKLAVEAPASAAGKQFYLSMLLRPDERSSHGWGETFRAGENLLGPYGNGNLRLTFSNQDQFVFGEGQIELSLEGGQVYPVKVTVTETLPTFSRD